MADEVELATVEDILTEEVSDDKPEETTEDTDVKTEVETEEVKTEEESTSDSKDQKVPLAALLDERDKRQKSEALVKQADERIAELTQAPEKERPDVFEDQQGAFDHIKSSLRDEITDRMFRISRAGMMREKNDYEELETEFMALAKETPSLRVDLLNHDDPAYFAYNTASKARLVKDMEDIEVTRDKIRAEEREKLIAEMADEKEGKNAKDAAKRDAITPSLATKRSTGTIEAETSELETIDDIL